MPDTTAHSPLIWVAFNAFILFILALDLGFFHRQRREIPLREALMMTAGYIALALLFNGWIYQQYGQRKALEFLTGYFIEYALSMDNIMVFVVILAHFQVPPQYQMRVLLWGIIGALVLRLAFILTGFALISAFDWIIVLLGIFLIYTGIKTLLSNDEPADFQQSRVVRYTRRLLPMTTEYHNEKFFIKSSAGKLYATPLFLVLIVLNVTDVIFAADSIPAVFAITRDPFIVYTSNVFAVLGLRALYFVLSGMLDKFRYLKFGLSLVLIFIGGKMVYNYPSEWPDLPTEWALIITAMLIFGSIIASLIRNRFPDKDEKIQAQR